MSKYDCHIFSPGHYPSFLSSVEYRKYRQVRVEMNKIGGKLKV